MRSKFVPPVQLTKPGGFAVGQRDEAEFDQGAIEEILGHLPPGVARGNIGSQETVHVALEGTGGDLFAAKRLRPLQQGGSQALAAKFRFVKMAEGPEPGGG